MKRLELKMVLSGLLTAWRLAICPTRISPFSFRSVGSALHLLPHLVEAAPDEALGAEDGVVGVAHGLALGDLSDQDLALLVPIGRERAPPLAPPRRSGAR